MMRLAVKTSPRWLRNPAATRRIASGATKLPARSLLAAVPRAGWFSLAASVALGCKLTSGKAVTSFAAGVSGDTAKLESVLQKADHMYDNPSEFTRQQLYDELKAIDLDTLSGPDRAAVLWRLTRATYERSQEPGIPSEAKAALIREAYEHVQVRAFHAFLKCSNIPCLYLCTYYSRRAALLCVVCGDIYLLCVCTVLHRQGLHRMTTTSSATPGLELS